MDRDEIPGESPPAYTDIAPSVTCYPGSPKPPPYSLTEGQQCDPSITPQFMLSYDRPPATFPLDTVYLIPPPLPQQPNQQHQQQQVEHRCGFYKAV